MHFSSQKRLQDNTGHRAWQVRLKGTNRWQPFEVEVGLRVLVAKGTPGNNTARQPSQCGSVLLVEEEDAALHYC